VRIVAGIYGGRKLRVPKGRDIRPTSDKVRGAIFNTLAGYLDFDGGRVLDAFCGTGALGLEALSRGVGYCLFADKAKASLDLARENAGDLGALDESGFKIGDASKVHLGQGGAFDLVFLDPPYGKGLIEAALENFLQQGVLSDEAVIVLESEKGFVLKSHVDFETLKDKLYGDTLVTYLRYKKSVP
jgi:16S rRNA (guanine966-N2)-methyltransferase